MVHEDRKVRVTGEGGDYRDVILKTGIRSRFFHPRSDIRMGNCPILAFYKPWKYRDSRPTVSCDWLNRHGVNYWKGSRTVARISPGHSEVPWEQRV